MRFLYAWMCAQPAEALRASFPQSSGKETRPKLSEMLLVVLDSVSLPHFSLSPFLFPISSPLFSAFTFPTSGAGAGGDSTLGYGGPGRPWAQSHRPPPGAERPLPGGSRRWSRDLGISRSRDPSPQGRTFERRTCLPWQRFVTFPSHGQGGGPRGPPGKERPFGLLFPFSVRGCLP